jgi:lysine-specific histone demethylase 1
MRSRITYTAASALCSARSYGSGVVCPQIVMLFPYAFWRKTDMFGRIAKSVADRGEFFLFYSYNHLSGGAVLAALVAGDAATRFEEEDPKVSTRKVLEALKPLFNSRGINVPAPLQVLSTLTPFDTPNSSVLCLLPLQNIRGES